MMLMPGFTAGEQTPADSLSRYSPWRLLLGALGAQRTTTDVSAQDRRQDELAAQVAALHRVQAVIEFALDGTILQANDNFLQAVGYRLDEIQGHHPALFDDPGHAPRAASPHSWAPLAAP